MATLRYFDKSARMSYAGAGEFAKIGEVRVDFVAGEIVVDGKQVEIYVFDEQTLGGGVVYYNKYRNDKMALAAAQCLADNLVHEGLLALDFGYRKI